MPLNGRTVVVTGGTGSLGVKLVKKLLDIGVNCSIPSSNIDELSDFPFYDHEQIQIVKGIDLTDENQASHFYDEVMEKWDSIWASVHLAGGFGMGKVESTSLEEFKYQMRLNAYTCYASCHAAVQKMKKAEEGGRIVNVASRPALEPRMGSELSAYTASKAAVSALTQSMAEELVSDDILVNAVAPSIIDTEANRRAMPDADHEKWPKPEQIADHIIYLISPQNEVTRGAVIPVYGEF